MISILKKINAYYQIKGTLKQVLKRAFLSVFFLRKPNWWSCIVAQDMNLLTFKSSDDFTYKYVTTNPLLLWRAQTLFTKEPETIAWLQSMKKGEILFDVGANVGMYSIYAGIRGIKVFSFEPEASNYYLLNQNIQSNFLSGVVTAYNFALSDTEMIDVLKLTSFVPGSAHTTFGDNDYYKQTNASTVFAQGAFSTTLDNLIYRNGLVVPDHLKIDVDGIEAKILKGAEKLLKDPTLKSILIELNEDMEEDRWIKSHLQELGFRTIANSKSERALRGNMTLKDYLFVRGS